MMTVCWRSYRMGRPLDGSEIKHHIPRVKRAMTGELAVGRALACFAVICRFVHGTVCDTRRRL
jgi:hypothetical protein